MSIQLIIKEINEKFTEAFAKVPGASIVGLTELVTKINADKSTLIIPGKIDASGEIKYIGIDDKNPLIIYHRLLTANQTERSGSSYGDYRTDVITTYSNALFGYADRKTVCADQSGLLELIQTNLPDSITIKGYKTVVIRITNINFNGQSILRTEYQGSDAKLRPDRVLIQINYQIETTFRKKCMSRCA